MLNAARQPQRDPADASPSSIASDTVETLLWLDEHDWLYGLMRSDHNVAPRFRMPDLISACISQLFAKDDASRKLFDYLGAELILREPGTVRRREVMWRLQFLQLQTLQLSAINRYPNPQFQLDQLTTGCVALARIEDASGACTLQHARINIARRSEIAKALCRPDELALPSAPTA